MLFQPKLFHLHRSCIYYTARGKSSKMNSISPPEAVKGMKEWRPELFNKKVQLPCLRVKSEHVSSLKAPLKNFVFKMPNLSNVQPAEMSENATNMGGDKLIILSPQTVKTFSDLSTVKEHLDKISVNDENFCLKDFTLTSDNWNPNDKLKHILPDGEDVSGFSRIGHIIHLNLKDYTEPYKNVIGHVLMELPGIKTVVAKTSNIDNTYRNFELEVLAGEKDFEVTVKENGNTFSFDFSKVYWNPRLSTEHERIVKMLKSDSILFDACAGVGPFAIPAARKCRVFANDLNPESYKWLQYNAKKNKIREDRINCHNLDARDFIKQVFLPEFLAMGKEENNQDRDIHITMNLPALAVTLIDVFQGLLWNDREKISGNEFPLPILHVYTFSKAEDPHKDVLQRVEEYLGITLDTVHLKEIAFVRSVAPNKDMYRASVKIPAEVLLRDLSKRKLAENSIDETNKRLKE